MGDYILIEEKIRSVFGMGKKIIQKKRIFGGDINEAYGLCLNDGTKVFLKTNTVEHAGFFTAEQHGLAAIAKTGTISTPAVYGSGIDPEKHCSYLMMEFLESARPAADAWERFAAELSAMHQADTNAFVPGGSYGFWEDNYIGAGRQKNNADQSWVSFYRKCRLQPQIEKASHYFDAKQRKRFGQLLDRLGDYLPEPDHPSLLHGDLWSGNVICGNDGKLWLIDPAVYVGHAEADLAMTELFGGFPALFYECYARQAGLDVGYEQQRDLYQLYHLLNHLNLFGSSYLAAVLNFLHKYGPNT